MSAFNLKIPVLLFIMFLPLMALPQNITPAEPYGDSKMVNDFINNEMIYPENALNKGLDGTVVLKCKIGTNGEVKDLQVEKSVGPEIDAEALRLFRMLLWKPATRMGHAVVTEVEFPIKFNIKKYKRIQKNKDNFKVDLPDLPIDSSNKLYKAKELDSPPRPVFQEKDMNLPKFIGANMKYPDDAFRQSIAGDVSLAFIVEPDGHISNIVIEKPLAGGCSQEAIRLLRLLHWEPGIKNDMLVRTRMHLGLTFRLTNDGGHQIYDNSQISNY
jgi:TonB family protein